jgi:hypothetical protein
MKKTAAHCVRVGYQENAATGFPSRTIPDGLKFNKYVSMLFNLALSWNFRVFGEETYFDRQSGIFLATIGVRNNAPREGHSHFFANLQRGVRHVISGKRMRNGEPTNGSNDKDANEVNFGTYLQRNPFLIWLERKDNREWPDRAAIRFIGLFGAICLLPFVSFP